MVGNAQLSAWHIVGTQEMLITNVYCDELVPGGQWYHLYSVVWYDEWLWGV